MSVHAVRSFGDLGDAITMAPERWCGPSAGDADGVPLGDLVVERRDRVLGAELARALVIDTTHAKDGLLDLSAAARAPEPPASAKKLARPGDLLVSRLRPYLRQIALVGDDVPEGRVLACSTEFYVLGPKRAGEALGFLVPWLLSDATQAALAAAQEGGHHPRVPREVVLAMRVPKASIASRRSASSRVEAAMRALAKAKAAWDATLASPDAKTR